MDKREIIDLTAAWAVLSVAFANLLGGLRFGPLWMSFVVVGTGFLLHELAHRVVARQYGLGAYFKADYPMLGLAFLLSFTGFIFAAPGAVYTRGERTDEEDSHISAAGPITNIILALVFLLVPGQLGSYGFQINAWLALFNMIPAGGLDGQSVFRSNKVFYFVIAGVAAFMVFVL